MTDTFTFPVSPGTAAEVVHSVRTAQFGDGYKQIAKQGLNTRVSQWTVVMQNLTQAQSDAVLDFIDDHAGQSFYWTPPRTSRQGRFMCSTYSLTPVEYKGQSISATFDEVFFP